MNPSRRDALVKLESELRVNLSLDGILPLLEKTQDGRGGFMTRVERMSVEAEGGDLARASKIIGLLRKKDNRAFDRFCEILCESGNEDWGKKLRDAAGVTQVDQSSSRARGRNAHYMLICHYVYVDFIFVSKDRIRELNIIQAGLSMPQL